MDIEKIIDEVVRRLMVLIEEEKKKDADNTIDAVSGATIVAPRCSKAAAGRKTLVTEAEAMGIMKNATVHYPKGTIITPLAKDVFKQRGIIVTIG